MTQLKVINQNGDELDTIEVNDAVFGVEVREHLFYEVVKWQEPAWTNFPSARRQIN